jgi:hypothetical protein
MRDRLRRREGRGFETRYLTDGGTRGLAIGDRFIFGQNNSKLGVVNGDTSSVTHTGSLIIRVQLDRTGDIVSFGPRKYHVLIGRSKEARLAASQTRTGRSHPRTPRRVVQAAVGDSGAQARGDDPRRRVESPQPKRWTVRESRSQRYRLKISLRRASGSESGNVPNNRPSQTTKS